ncbi:MAG TPA: transcription elongation factor GreA [Gaiellaceae bacterium]|nr:transcription elongation factor GreA [Gaiellaceae bacterium]
MAREHEEHLTLAQKEQLERELAELEGPRRKAAVDAIAHARGYGDLSENFEYHAAKNEQGLLERQITLLRDRLHRAVIVDEEAAAADGSVAVGATVEIEDEHGERMEVEISSVGGVSPVSPLGKALIGARIGDEVDVEAPRGAWRARVLAIRF